MKNHDEGSLKYCFDANIFITTWYQTYPPEIFESLWDQLKNSKDEIILIKEIFDEIEPITGNNRKIHSTEELEKKNALRTWLEDNKFDALVVEEPVHSIALSMEKKYQIKHNSKGASVNDILLIAYAKHHNYSVVTFEAQQPQIPEDKSKYKIPLICKDQNVEYLNFVEFLREVGIKI